MLPFFFVFFKFSLSFSFSLFPSPHKTIKEEDRLSALPEEVISHILSFLSTTKFAATTSVLSKRWRFLFHSVSTIDVDEACKPYPEDKFPIPRLQVLFHDFVDRLLLHPPQEAASSHQLRRFRLRCKKFLLADTEDEEDDHIHSWIRAAISRRVQDLELLVPYGRSVKLPHEFFNSKSIESLSLHGTFILDPPSTIPSSVTQYSLPPNLVNVNLVLVRLDGSCLRRAFSTLQHLKHLRLYFCISADETQVLEIVSPSLESLILDMWGSLNKIDLYTPNLELFKCTGIWGRLQVKEDTSRLVTAEVEADIYVKGPDTPDAHYMIMKEMLHNVRALAFNVTSDGTVGDLCDSPCPWPTLHSLTVLKLCVNHKAGWKILNKFLECSPNLQVLHFNQRFYCDHVYGCAQETETVCSLPGIVPVCLSRHLREIKFGDFCATEFEFELVEYFLRSARVLEKIKIRPKLSWDMSSSQKLLAYPRCSNTCKIVVSWKTLKGFCDATQLNLWGQLHKES